MSVRPKPCIFIDTCSLLDSCWNRVSHKGEPERYEYSKEKELVFWGREFRGLEAIGDVIVPARNYEELIKHSKNAKKEGLASRSNVILHKIVELHNAKRIQIIGDPNDPFADAILLSVALKFRTQKDMAFITQDRKLAEDLEAIRHFRSVERRKGYDIKIRRIAKDGSLKRHKGLWSRDKEPTVKHFEKKKKGASTNQKAIATSSNWWEQ